MAGKEGGAELVSFRELARRLVAENVVQAISHQRVSQLSREDPDFPAVVTVGRSKVVDWHLAEPYFRHRAAGQGRRTDLEAKRAAKEQPSDRTDPRADDPPRSGS